MSVSLSCEYRARSFCKDNVYARAGDENPTQCDVKEPNQRSQSDWQAAESYSDSWVHERYEQREDGAEQPQQDGLLTPQQPAAHLVSCEKRDRDCERSKIIGKGVGCRE